MTWTTPRTWTAGEKVTAALLNTHLKDNLDALKNPPKLLVANTNGSNFTTTSTTFANISTTYFEVTITTAVEGDVVIGGHFSIRCSGSATTRIVTLELVRETSGVTTSLTGGQGFMVLQGATGTTHPVTLNFLAEDVPAGTHKFRLQWKVENVADTATLFAQNGGVFNNRGQFWAKVA
jgi:hypothetical protein